MKVPDIIFDKYRAEGWTQSYDGAVFTCPCGHRIEPDGRCPEGHRSPLLQEGLI